jgi:hypothetical protein
MAVSDWLELELSECLAPVEAPDELWQRVAGGGRWAHRPLPFVAPIAAVVTLILAGAIWFLARGQQPSGALRPYPVSARAEACLLCHTTL